MSTPPDEPGTGPERIGDAQRAAVLDLVDRAYVEGFLDSGEHETRRAGVTGSKAVAELHAQVADLPPQFHWVPAHHPVPPSNRGMAVMSVVLGVVSIPMFLCLGTGAAVGGLAVFAGTRALRQDSSRPTAIAGIVLGAVGVVLGLGFLALLVFSSDQTTVRTR
ncbi:DUF1707 and DUF4190 domain-containing protein [Virgisporangium aurantiacum]|nr:DUF1707 and DUF4190 domain-containing protein [Virgisporangium aurantiacum]